MNRLSLLAALTTGAITISNLAAQNAATAAPVSPPAAANDGSWHLPLHAAPGVTSPSRLWASGDTYKASFDDGMTFYPVLGETAPHNLPWRWRTASIGRADHAPFVDAENVAARATMNDGFRYELGYGGGVDEIYEIRADGVEQLFELEALPAAGGGGDLVVRGRIDSELECAPRGPAHESLVFRDRSGSPVVAYGAATAIDADGDTLALDTSYDDGILEIRVPAAWLENAAYPLTIDPLTSRVTASSSSTSSAYCPQIARDEENDRYVIHDVRTVSAGDRDIRLRRVDDDFGGVTTLFANLTTADTRIGSVAATWAVDRWLLAYDSLTLIDSVVRVYIHHMASSALNSGVQRTVPRPVGYQDFAPSIGGAQLGERAYLALRRDQSNSPFNTDRSIPVGFFVDPLAATIGPAQVLHTNPGSNYDAERVQVSQLAFGNSGWLVIWQEYNFNNPGDDWDVIGQRVDGFGTLDGHHVFGQSGSNGLHKIGPAVAGRLFDFGVFYVTTPNAGSRYTGRRGRRLWFQRVSWGAGSSSPYSVEAPVLVDEGTTDFSIEFGESSRRAAFDYLTEGNWGTVWRRFDLGELHAARIASDGAAAERVVLEDNPLQRFAGYYQPSITFESDTPGFAIVYTSVNVASFDPIYARRLTFPSDAAVIPYGSSCFGQLVFGNEGSPPYAGSRGCYVWLQNGLASRPTWFLVSAAPTDVPLPAGFAGCRLLISPQPELLTAGAMVSGSTGSALVYMDLPGEAAGLDLFWQAIQLDQGFLWSSEGLEMRIR